MVKLFRIWRFVRVVNKENKKIGYKDKFAMGLYENEGWKCVTSMQAMSAFKVFTRDKSKKEYIAKRTMNAALKSNYLTPHRSGSITLLEVNAEKGTGEDLIDGYIWGLFRELLNKERRTIDIFLTIAGVLAGYIIGRYT